MGNGGLTCYEESGLNLSRGQLRHASRGEMRLSDATLHLKMPSLYYCRECAEKRSLLYPPPEDPLASQYQVEKYLKHTIRDPAFSVQSVFTARSTQGYADYFVAAQAPVAVEIDEKGRRNIIVAAGKVVGVQLNQGQLVGPPQDAVKVVLSSDPWKVHAYPANSTTFTGAKCSDL